jgi:ubiquinone/menaquinone biosynthesis C-methylase UbiE
MRAGRVAGEPRERHAPMKSATGDRYVPAAGREAFTRAYDVVVALTMRERRWRPALTEAVIGGLPAGATVVDVGSGTGTQAIALARARPDVHVIAVEGDPQAEALARRKAGAERVDWRRGLASTLPLADASAHRVVMSLLLHHLPPDGKRAALAEARRVLRPGGELHVADWGRPAGPLMRCGFFALQLIDGFAGTRDHAAGRLHGFIAVAGFVEPQTYRRLRTTWGSLELLRAVRPDSSELA